MKKKSFRLNEPDVSAEDFKSEILALNLKNGYYHSLREAAVPIWRLLMQGYTEEEVIQHLANFYAAEQGSLTKEVEVFLRELEKAELIVPREEAHPPSADAAVDYLCDLPTTYAPPLLETYTDMRDLLMLDPIHDVDVAGWPHVPESPKT